MKCTNCGKEVPENARGCGYCGTPVKQAGAVRPAAETQKPAPQKAAPETAAPASGPAAGKMKLPKLALPAGLGAAALVLVVVLFAVKSPSQPAQPPQPEVVPTESSPFASAQGNWVAIDSDESAMTLKISRDPDGSYDVVLFDDGASVCGYDSTGESLLSYSSQGTGTAHAYVLDVHEVGKCAETEEEITYDYSLTFDPEADTLLDTEEITWHRE